MYDIEWVNQMALDLFSAGCPTPAESPDLADGRREWPRVCKRRPPAPVEVKKAGRWTAFVCVRSAIRL